MSCNFLSWNMRGSRSQEKARDLRRAIRKFKPIVVTIQETKRESLDERVVNFLWGSGKRSWAECGSKGAAGGITVLWDSERVEVQDMHIGKFSNGPFFYLFKWTKPSSNE
ncbi:alpha-amylase [Ranunculus cassubicifolius]